jgi:hypothetical protein
MGVAVEIEVMPSRAAGRWAAAGTLVGVLGLLLAAMHLMSGPTLLVDAPSHRRAALAAGCAALAAWGALLALRDLRGARRAPTGLALRVGEDGEAVLHGPAPTPARPMALRATCTLPGLTLLVMAPYSPQPSVWRRFARPTVLLLGRDVVPQDDWRRLHVWLRWIERGRSGP